MRGYGAVCRLPRSGESGLRVHFLFTFHGEIYPYFPLWPIRVRGCNCERPWAQRTRTDLWAASCRERCRLPAGKCAKGDEKTAQDVNRRVAHALSLFDAPGQDALKPTCAHGRSKSSPNRHKTARTLAGRRACAGHTLPGCRAAFRQLAETLRAPVPVAAPTLAVRGS